MLKSQQKLKIHFFFPPEFFSYKIWGKLNCKVTIVLEQDVPFGVENLLITIKQKNSTRNLPVSEFRKHQKYDNISPILHL